MPKVVRAQDWEKVFREEVSDLSKGWNVREKRGKVFLRIRTEETTATAYLPFKWQKDQKTAALNRIQNIYFLVKEEGRDLKTANQIAAGDAPKLQIEHDWEGAKTRFEKQKINFSDSIKKSTWDKNYDPVISNAVSLLIQGSVSNPEDLMDRCIEKWEVGSRTRQIRSQSLKQFLDYCVTREKFPVAWLLTTKLKDHVGQRATKNEIQSGDPLEDQQIINLINAFPQTDNGKRWADACRLISELGLRPIELNHLHTRKDSKTKELYWWCSYQKRSGGGTTEPRRIFPLPLVDDQGEVQQWNLIERWHAKLIRLPDAVESQHGLRDYLRKVPAWNSLQDEQKEKGLVLKPYSMRHSYSTRGHARDIDTGSLAKSMGHSLECHLRAYPTETEKGTKTAFEKASEKLAIAA
tara:strand:+ start:300 stop:1523 length:1224 start_codon:yes stop_codon:yes gene_type:complete